MIAVFLGAEVCAFGQQPSADAFRKVLSQASEKSHAQEWAAAIPLWEQVWRYDVSYDIHPSAFAHRQYEQKLKPVVQESLSKEPKNKVVTESFTL